MPKRYKIEVVETMSRIIEIEADSEAQAVERVEKQYKNANFVLDPLSDFLDYEIKPYKE